MHITQVTAKNLKGRTFAHDLKPLTLIVGPNFSGKTAIVEAIRLCLLGYIPELGKRTSDSFELSSASRMDVALTFQDGPLPRLERSLWMERNAIRNSFTANSVEWGNALLDAGQYFELSDRARVDYVFERITLPEEFTAAGILAKLHRVSMGETHSVHHQEQKANLLKWIEDEFKQGPLPVEIEKVDKFLSEEFTDFNRRARDSEGAVRTLTELKLRESECNATTLTDIRNEISRVETLLAEANAEEGALFARAKQSRTLSDRRRELVAKLEAPAQDYTPVIRDLEEKLAALPNLNMPSDDDWRRVTEQERSVISVLETAKGDWRRLEGELNEVMKAMEECDQLVECPTCHGKAKGWKKKMGEALTKRVSDLNGRLVDARQRLTNAQATFDTATRNTSELSSRIANARAVQHERSEREHNLNVMRRQAQQEAELRRATQEELDRLEAIPEPPTESELAVSRKRLDELTAKNAGLKSSLRDAERLAHDIRRGEEAAEVHQKAVASAEITKALGTALREVRGEIVSVAFDELLVTANNLADGILPSPLAFRENQIGRYTPSGFVGHGTFSGTEKALTYVALAAALSSQSPFRLLILDELSRLTGDVQQKALTAFAEAVAHGKLDQVIAVIPADPDDMLMNESMSEIAFGGGVWSLIRTKP